MKENTHGGRRAGAGRKRGPETKVLQVTVDAKLLERLRVMFGNKVINNKVREFLAAIDSQPKKNVL